MIVAGFDFPDDLHLAADDLVWARDEGGGRVRVGITALGIHLAGGEIYMCRPKAVGTPVERGRAIAVIELAKSIVAVHCPVTGRVESVNPDLEDAPEWVHRQPYGRGWIACLQVADAAAELAGLAHGEAARAALERAAHLNRLPP